MFFDILRMFLHFLWIYMDKIYSVKTILTYVFLEENLINLRFDWRTNNKYNNNNNKIVYYLHTLQYNMFKDYVRDKQNISTVVPYRVQYKLVLVCWHILIVLPFLMFIVILMMRQGVFTFTQIVWSMIRHNKSRKY